MNDPSARSTCLDAETLAAFVDGRLDAQRRTAAEAHLASCEDCYETLVMTGHLSDAVSNTKADFGRGRAIQTRRLYLGLLAAASITLVLAWPGRNMLRSWQLENALRDLVTSVGTDRFAEARTSEPFEWGPRPSVTRSGDGARIPDSIQAASGEVLLRGAKVDSVRSQQVQAIASMAAGRVDHAIALLQLAKSSNASSAEVRTDLSAALFERYRRSGRTEDANAALTEAEAALSLVPRSPAALFNRALATEAALGRVQAESAWQAYLNVDSTSKWAEEVHARLREK